MKPIETTHRIILVQLRDVYSSFSLFRIDPFSLLLYVWGYIFAVCLGLYLLPFLGKDPGTIFRQAAPRQDGPTTVLHCGCGILEIVNATFLFVMS